MPQPTSPSPSTAPGTAPPPPSPSPSLPLTPRPLTPHVSRRLWIDPRVRFWWLVAAFLLGVAAYFAALRIDEWKLDSDLITHGTPVTATIGVEGVPRPGYVPPAGTPLTLSFDLNGQPQQVTGTLEGQTAPVATAQKIRLRVDPNDLSRWTDLTEPRPIGSYLLMPILMLPVAAAAFAAAWWLRRGLLRTYRNGTPMAAVIVQRHQSALAPLSQTLRCTIPGRADKRVIVAYLPCQAPRLGRGETVWLIGGARADGPIVAADWVHEMDHT